MYMTIKESATRSVKWSVIGQWVRRVAQLGVLLLLARNLSAGEYGVVEFITLVLTLGQLLQDFGLGRALVQTQSDIEEASTIVFWFSLLLSVLIYGLIFVSAPMLAHIFGEDSITIVLQIAGLQLALISLRSVQTALVQRLFLYRSQFLADLIGSASLVIAVILLLAAGYRVWAFVYGTLISSVLHTVTLAFVVPWRPALRFSLTSQTALPLVRFGAYASLESIQGWLLSYGDNLLIGYFLGLEALGVYALAFNIAVFSFSILLQPLTSISYAAFSRLQADLIEVRRAFLNTLKIASMILIPMGAGIFVLASPISQVVLGGRWSGIEPIIQLLAIFPGSVAHLLFINPELYRSLGMPKIMPKLLLLSLAYSVPAYFFGTQYGLIGVTLARISVTAVFFPIQVFIALRILELNLGQYLRYLTMPTLLSIIMASVSSILISQMDLIPNWMGWFQLFFLILSGASIYMLMYWLLDRTTINKAFVLLKQMI
jgi:O-antigen/teichoic acid export membrane protein